MRTITRWTAIASCLLGSAQAQVPQLIDLNTGAGPAVGSAPREFHTRADGLTLFQACTPELGCELWRTDGTTGGTQLVRDIRPGTASSAPFGLIAAASGLFYFAADDGSHGRELWRSDGTAAGTQLVADIEPGVAGSEPRSVLRRPGGEVMFSASTLAQGLEIYVGDAQGAGLLLDLVPGVGSGLANQTGGVPDLVAVGTRVVFSGIFNGNSAPYISDGTVAGTTPLVGAPGPAEAREPRGFIAFGSGMLFLANGSLSNGRDLFRSDFTRAGTQQINPTGTRVFHILGVAGSVAVLAARSSTAQGIELFTFDGSNLSLLRDLHPSGSAFSAFSAHSASVGSQVFFAANDGSSGEELYRSDGTLAGTVRVSDQIAGAGSSSPRRLLGYTRTGFSGVVYIAQTDPNSSLGALMRSDGSAAGTFALGLRASVDTPLHATPGSNSRVLLASAGAVDSADVELHRSDASVAGSTRLADLASLQSSSSPSRIITAQDRAYFTAYTPNAGRELHVSFGTAASTQLVLDQTPGSAGSFGFDSNEDLLGAALGTRLLYLSVEANESTRLRVSDGTAAGSQLLLATALSAASPPINVGSRVFLSAISNGTRRLLASDGTPGGTQFLNLPCTPTQDPMLAFGSRLILICADPALGSELHAVDSNTLTATLIADLTPGLDDSELNLLGVHPSAGLFLVERRFNGDSILIGSNATPAGTQTIASASQREFRSGVVVAHDSSVYLRGSNAGSEVLFRLNGNASSLSVVDSVAFPPSAPDLNPYLASTGCSVLRDRFASGEAWETRRFETATQSAINLNLFPGPASSELQELIVVKGSDRYLGRGIVSLDSGVELLTLIDGAPSAQVIDIATGSESSNPRHLSGFGAALLFSAHTPANGRELYLLPAPDRIFKQGSDTPCSAL